jgi:hypothetical protein
MKVGLCKKTDFLVPLDMLGKIRPPKISNKTAEIIIYKNVKTVLN